MFGLALVDAVLVRRAHIARTARRAPRHDTRPDERFHELLQLSRLRREALYSGPGLRQVNSLELAIGEIDCHVNDSNGALDVALRRLHRDCRNIADTGAAKQDAWKAFVCDPRNCRSSGSCSWDFSGISSSPRHD